MFFDELSPIFKEITQQPAAFFGGLFSGLLRLSLADEPVKGWLDQHSTGAYSPSTQGRNGNGSGPQSISID